MPQKTDLKSFRIIGTLQESKRYILYKAESMRSQNRVVIKTQVAAALMDHKLKESLINESAAALKLYHPYIRKGLAHFEEEQQVYLVAEYVDGISLARYLLNYPQGVSSELGILWAKNIAEALHYALRKGIRHLNLNPYNIIIDPTNQLKIIGFGKDRQAWKHSEGNFKYHLPILYTPKEEFKGSLIQDNSDLYSWAVVVYQILTGTIPWRVDSFMSPEEQKEQCLTRAVQQPDPARIPDWLYSLILDCLKLDPKERIANPAILLQALKLEGSFVDYAQLQELAEQEEADLVWREELAASQIDSSETGVEKSEEIVEPEAQPGVEAETLLPGTESSEIEEIQICEEEQEMGSEPNFETEIPTWDFEKSGPVLEAEIEPEAEAETFPEQEESTGEVAALPAKTEQSPIDTKPESMPEEPELSLAEAPVAQEAQDIEPMVELPDLESATETEELVLPEQEEEEPLVEPEQDLVIPVLPVKEDVLPEKRINKAEENSPLVPKVLEPAPKAREKAPEPIVNYARPAQAREDLSTMKKTFRILMLASVLIVIYLGGRYLLTPKPEKFEVSQESVQEQEPLQASLLKENIPLDMIRVPGDTLVMGSISPEADDDEFPLLTIGVKSFLMSSTEITQQQWMMVNTQNPADFKNPDRPVENVSFYDVIDYCNAKSIKDNLTPAYDVYGSEIVCDFDADGYRLPTEAEWELAAKAGKGREYQRFSGADDPLSIAWYNANAGAKTHIVATKGANELGLYDLCGNVAEWVWNWYAPYTYRIPNLNTGPSSGTDKVIRGGNWQNSEHGIRISNREYMKPFTKNNLTGFRVVRSR